MASEGSDGRRAVEVTGVGVVSPAGSDIDEVWDTLLSGQSTATSLDWAHDLTVSFGCPIRGYEPERQLTRKEIRRLAPFTRFALCAALDAVDDAGLADVDPTRCAVIVGTGGTGTGLEDDAQSMVEERDLRRINPLAVPTAMANAPAALVSIRLGFSGPSLTVSTACASGGHAIGEALRLLRDGAVDVVVAGGTEAPLSRYTLEAFGRLGALSGRNEQPEAASRPFDRDRDGFVMGEGAAFLVLEAPEHAAARRARVRARLLGYGCNSDAHHLVEPHADGHGAAACMRLALADARTDEPVAHINAHGTSTPLNDAAESMAIASAFDGQAPPVTSIKGVVGHLIGAAGALEAVASVLTLENGLIPPTANFTAGSVNSPPLDVVRGTPRPLSSGVVLSNSFGFGGHNVSLCFGERQAA